MIYKYIDVFETAKFESRVVSQKPVVRTLSNEVPLLPGQMNEQWSRRSYSQLKTNDFRLRTPDCPPAVSHINLHNTLPGWQSVPYEYLFLLFRHLPAPRSYQN